MKNSFLPETPPFPEWFGPYSPTRGNTRGLRIRNNKLGMFFNNETEQRFCPATVTDGISALVNLVTQHYAGGRILFLPNGLVIKPLQQDTERGRRVVIGRYSGGIDIKSDNGDFFSTEKLNTMKPGEILLKSFSSTSVGLECNIQGDGSLKTEWYNQSGLVQNIQITGCNQGLISGFYKARPDNSGGRVHVIIGGYVLTKREVNSEWHTYYVGRIDSVSFEDWYNRWSANK